MKLENQVCTLEQAKRLKELGVNALSYFSWFGDENKHNLTDNKEGVTLNAWLYVASTEPINNQQVELRENTEQVTPLAPAYNVAELGVMLPEHYYSYRTLNNSLYSGQFWCIYDTGEECELCGVEEYNTFKDTVDYREAVSRASMLIYCLENNLTTPDEVNQRLNNA